MTIAVVDQSSRFAINLGRLSTQFSNASSLHDLSQMTLEHCSSLPKALQNAPLATKLDQTVPAHASLRSKIPAQSFEAKPTQPSPTPAPHLQESRGCDPT